MKKISELWNKIPKVGQNVICSLGVVALFFAIIGLGILLSA